MRQRAITIIAVVAVVAVLGVFAIDRSKECAPQLSVAGTDFTVVNTGDGIEVVATSTEGFFVGALVWILEIGDLQFSRSTYPDFDTHTLAFPIPEAAVTSLADGDPVTVSYGTPVYTGSSDYGEVPRESTAEAPNRLRIVEDC